MKIVTRCRRDRKFFARRPLSLSMSALILLCLSGVFLLDPAIVCAQNSPPSARPDEDRIDPALFGDWAGVDADNDLKFFVHIVRPRGLANTAPAAALVYSHPSDTRAASKGSLLTLNSVLTFALKPVAGRSNQISLFLVDQRDDPAAFDDCCELAQDAKPAVFALYDQKADRLSIRLRDPAMGPDRNDDADSGYDILLKRVVLSPEK